MNPTWQCPQCALSGEGLPPEECPDCEWYFSDYSSGHLTEAGYKAAIRLHANLKYRAEVVADILDYGHESIDFDSADREGGTFEVTWESANCRCGCSGYSTHTKSIPTRYLWMSDADIRTELAAQKAAEEAKAAEVARKKAIAEAEAALARAQARAGTAAAEAARALVDAERQLAALQGAS